jgi:hypothetical protein
MARLRRKVVFWCVVCLGLSPAAAAQAPQAEISNSRIHAKLYLPDAQSGYYRATRFDWSGVIASLKCNGHNYFGKWFDQYDPKVHDAISGPVEEFLSNGAGLGYAEVKLIFDSDSLKVIHSSRVTFSRNA